MDEELDFLYPAKMEKLAPFMPAVTDTWRCLRDAGGSLMKIVDAIGDEPNQWASITGWLSTHDSWNWQHLVSAGHPVFPRAAMLGSQADAIGDLSIQSPQNWFRPDNRFPARVFATLVETVGKMAATLETMDFVT